MYEGVVLEGAGLIDGPGLDGGDGGDAVGGAHPVVLDGGAEGGELEGIAVVRVTEGVAPGVEPLADFGFGAVGGTGEGGEVSGKVVESEEELVELCGGGMGQILDDVDGDEVMEAEDGLLGVFVAAVEKEVAESLSAALEGVEEMTETLSELIEFGVWWRKW